MKTAEEYVRQQFATGHLTESDIVRLAKFFQHNFGTEPPLAVDGMPGPMTLTALREAFGDEIAQPTPPDRDTFGLVQPIPVLADGRRPVVTSGFGQRGEGEKKHFHAGVDMFYPFRDGDEPSEIGDGLAADRVKDPKTGVAKPRWVVPYGTPAVAAASGTVSWIGDIATGGAVWIDIGSGWRIGYFHLSRIGVRVGQRVEAGHPIGDVGHNPIDGDARHLHFELSPSDRYAPIDPQPYIRNLGKWEDK